MNFSLLYSNIVGMFLLYKPGSWVLYLGAASGTTVSHVSGLIGLVSFSLF